MMVALLYIKYRYHYVTTFSVDWKHKNTKIDTTVEDFCSRMSLHSRQIETQRRDCARMVVLLVWYIPRLFLVHRRQTNSICLKEKVCNSLTRRHGKTGESRVRRVVVMLNVWRKKGGSLFTRRAGDSTNGKWSG